MRVSICIPVYGVEKYIEMCARSVFEQTYGEIEYIFVDDCSPDNSIAVLQSVLKDYPTREPLVKIIHHEQNRGLAAARNTAVQQASGDYIMHVDSDDYLELDAVEKAVAKTQSEKADVVIFDMNLVFIDGRTMQESARVPTNRLEYLHWLIRRDSTVGVCGGMYRRSLYTDNNIGAIEGLNYGEDYVTKPRLIYYAQRISYLPEPLYNYVQYNSNAYTQNVTRKSIEDVLKACEILESFFHNLKDYTLNYDEIDAELKIRNKVFLLEYCKKEDRKYVNGLFPEMKDKNTPMALKHKIVWWLSCRNMLLAMNTYISVSHMVKRIFHI